MRTTGQWAENGASLPLRRPGCNEDILVTCLRNGTVTVYTPGRWLWPWCSLMLLMHMPTPRQVDDWIERQSLALEQQNWQ